MPVKDITGKIYHKPTKVGDTRRYVFNDMEKATQLINKYNGKANTISISVNPYLELNKNHKPNYDTIFVRRIFFDLDEPRMDDVRALSHHFSKNNIMHQIRFSGHGFHILPFVTGLTTNINESMMMIQESLQSKLGISFCSDEDAGYCRKDKLVRVPNTYNKKRKRFCIPLKKEDLDLSYNEIREMAKNQRFISPIVGECLWDLSGHNVSGTFLKKRRNVSKHLNNIVPIHINDALASIGMEYNDLCPAIKYLLSKYVLNHKERYLLIVYLKDICGFKYQEVINILKDSVIDDRFAHSHYFEHQIYYIYKHNYHHNCSKMNRFGFCVDNCDRRWLDI